MWSLLISFTYRFYILEYGSPSKLQICAAILLIYIPSFGQAVSFTFSGGDDLEMIEFLQQNFPNYTFDASMVTGNPDLFAPITLYTVLHMTLPIFPIYHIILKMRSRISKKLETTTEHLRKETRQLHKQLLKALTYQACLPIFFVISVIIFFIQVSRIYTHPILECLIFACPAFIPVLSALISITHIKPYRDIVVGIVMYPIRGKLDKKQDPFIFSMSLNARPVIGNNRISTLAN